MSTYDDDRDDLIDGVGFSDPGGRSALRAATRRNPRNRPCPTCGRKNVLTALDVARHYQCDACAERCFCGWSRSGGDGRRELVEMDETIEPED